MKLVPLNAKGLAEKKALDQIKHRRHPNLLPLFDYWERNGRLVICTQLADKSLADRLEETRQNKRPGIPVAELRKYMMSIARVLDYLRQNKIQHCDVKPSNILLSSGVAVLGDFSLARVLSKSVERYSGGKTNSYAPPEFDRNYVSLRSDQYMLAITYCELRTGQLPKRKGRTISNLNMPPHELGVILYSLSRHPKDRWPSCRALIAELCREDMGTTAEGVEEHIKQCIMSEINAVLVTALDLAAKSLLKGEDGWKAARRRLVKRRAFANDIENLELVKTDWPKPRNAGFLPNDLSNAISAFMQTWESKPRTLENWESYLLLYKPEIMMTYENLQVPIKLKGYQRRIAEWYQLDLHAIQREYLSIIETFLASQQG